MNFDALKCMRTISFTILLTLLLSSLIPACSSKKSVVSMSSEEKARCGYCLSQKNAPKVCTNLGTLLNACVAICKNVKVECYTACPCAPSPK